MSAASDAAAIAAFHAPFARVASVVVPKPVLKAGKLATVARPAGADGVFMDPAADAVVVAPPKVVG